VFRYFFIFLCTRMNHCWSSVKAQANSHKVATTLNVGAITKQLVRICKTPLNVLRQQPDEAGGNVKDHIPYSLASSRKAARIEISYYSQTAIMFSSSENIGKVAKISIQ